LLARQRRSPSSPRAPAVNGGDHAELHLRRSAHRLEGIEPRVTRRTLLVAGLGAFICYRLHFVASHWYMFAHKRWNVLALLVRSSSGLRWP
jgi:hypothetical protein